MAHGRRKIIWK